jgi:hypothetical protein
MNMEDKTESFDSLAAALIQREHKRRRMVIVSIVVAACLGVAVTIGAILATGNAKSATTKSVFYSHAQDSVNHAMDSLKAVARKGLLGDSTAIKKALAAIADTSNQFWVFVGTTQRGSRAPVSQTYFSVQMVPDSGMTIVSTGDVYKRDERPRQIGGEWRKGNVVGVVNAGDSVTILKIDSGPRGNNTTRGWGLVLATKTGRSVDSLQKNPKSPVKR